MSILVSNQGRRYNSFMPTDISGCMLWYQADVQSGYSENLPSGSAIDSWSDLSGNARNIAQGTAGRTPTLTANVINGKSALNFDGTADCLLATGASYWNVSDLTGFLVIGSQTSNATNQRAVYVASAAGSNRLLILFNTDGSATFLCSSTGTGASASITAASGLDITQPHIYCFYRNGSQLCISVDNGKYSSVATNANTPFTDCDLFNFSRVNFASNFFSGNMCSFIAYDSYLDAAERSRVFNYLSSYYGISLA